MRNQRSGRGLSLCAWLLLAVYQLDGHAILQKSSPGRNQTVGGPMVRFSLKFNSRIDAARSKMEVVSGSEPAIPVKLDQQASQDELAGRAGDLKPGHYTLRWQVLATDGHITQGVVPFLVQ